MLQTIEVEIDPSGHIHPLALPSTCWLQSHPVMVATNSFNIALH
jgi:hypothetical protein